MIKNAHKSWDEALVKNTGSSVALVLVCSANLGAPLGNNDNLHSRRPKGRVAAKGYVGYVLLVGIIYYF